MYLCKYKTQSAGFHLNPRQHVIALLTWPGNAWILPVIVTLTLQFYQLQKIVIGFHKQNKRLIRCLLGANMCIGEVGNFSRGWRNEPTETTLRDSPLAQENN